MRYDRIHGEILEFVKNNESIRSTKYPLSTHCKMCGYISQRKGAVRRICPGVVQDVKRVWQMTASQDPPLTLNHVFLCDVVL